MNAFENMKINNCFKKHEQVRTFYCQMAGWGEGRHLKEEIQKCSDKPRGKIF